MGVGQWASGCTCGIRQAFRRDVFLWVCYSCDLSTQAGYRCPQVGALYLMNDAGLHRLHQPTLALWLPGKGKMECLIALYPKGPQLDLLQVRKQQQRALYG